MASRVSNGFDPLSFFALGERGAWYDSSDLSKLWQDSARTTPVTAHGDPVGARDDKSGLGQHQTQPDNAKRPIYQTDGTYHWLKYDNVDDELRSDITGLTSTMYFVLGVRRVAGDADAMLLSFLSAAAAGTGQLLTYQSGSGTNIASSVGTPTTYVNNTLISPATRGQFFTDLPDDTDKVVEAVNVDVADTLTVIHNNYYGTGWVPAGRDYGMIVREAMSVDERTDAQNYMAGQMGVTL